MKTFYRSKKKSRDFNFIEVYEGSLSVSFYYHFTIMIEHNGIKKVYIGKVSEKQMQEEVADMERLYEDEVKKIICNTILNY
ncbi:MAG: hypothetical protein Q4Q06_04995 [Bacteroidota bacterium]|nr:hypothetical protein [Bacteroidota bacterium]